MAPASRRILHSNTHHVVPSVTPLHGEECYNVLTCKVMWHHLACGFAPIKGPLSGRCRTACTLILRPEAGWEGFSELI